MSEILTPQHIANLLTIGGSNRLCDSHEAQRSENAELRARANEMEANADDLEADFSQMTSERNVGLDTILNLQSQVAALREAFEPVRRVLESGHRPSQSPETWKQWNNFLGVLADTSPVATAEEE